MAKLVKPVKTTSSKKLLKETAVPVNSDNEMIPDFDSDAIEFDTIVDGSDDEAPEAVSTSTTKSKIISQIKSEREARRLEKESKRQKTINLQSQNRQARLKKSKEVEAVEDELSADEDMISSSTAPALCPLPENIFETVINQQQQNKIRFDSERESDSDQVASSDTVNKADILETVRLTRANYFKRNAIKALPFGVVEVGTDGKARISKAEIKSRRAISKLKLEKAGSQVRRIDSILDRSRKTRSAPAVFHRQNSFY